MKHEEIDNILEDGAILAIGGTMFPVVDAGYHEGFFWWLDQSDHTHRGRATLQLVPGNVLINFHDGTDFGTFAALSGALEVLDTVEYNDLILQQVQIDRPTLRKTMEFEIENFLKGPQ